MVKRLPVEELTEQGFAPYGWLIDAERTTPKMKEDIFTFWDGLAELDIQGKTTLGLLEVVARSPEFSKLERHVKTEEAFVALDGSVVVLVSPPTPEKDLPDPTKVKAFRLEAGKGVHLRQGTWHWIPYPLQKRVRLLVVFRQGTPDEDLDIKDLRELIGVSFEIVY